MHPCARTCHAAFAALLLLATAALPVEAQPVEAQQAVERLFGEGRAETDWFAESFLSQVPADQVQAIVDRLEAEYGPLENVSGSGTALTAHLRDARVPVRIQLDSDGRIAGLLFQAPILTGKSLAEYVQAIGAFPGETSVLVSTDGEIRVSHRPDATMAVGSAAKLAIVVALERAVADGRLAWDQAVPLDPSWRSLPTGILQDWPDGTPVTIATLAGLMISISDNTATDALIDLVGRESVEAVTPRNAPFATTAELFKLKAAGNEDLRKAWLEGDAAARREVLERLAGLPLPAPGALADPKGEVEWFMSATKLCALLDEAAGLPALGINPGLADPGEWDAIAFKGGSDGGVLNFSTRLEADGETHCVAATWNHTGTLDTSRLAAPYRGILAALGASASE